MELKINNGLYTKYEEEIKSCDNPLDMITLLDNYNSFNHPASFFYLYADIKNQTLAFFEKDINRFENKETIKIRTMLTSDNFIISHLNIEKLEDINSILENNNYEELYNYVKSYNKNNSYDIVVLDKV